MDWFNTIKISLKDLLLIKNIEIIASDHSSVHFEKVNKIVDSSIRWISKDCN
jgi:hypothetical protein